MLKTIFLLAPIFVSLFWSVILIMNKKQADTPRLFLSVFMVLSGLIFTAHFLYFAPLPDIYLWFDIPLHFMGLAIFPMYHIYFRLLTVDSKFTLTSHGRYLIIPAAMGLIYVAGVLGTPWNEYKGWLITQTNEQQLDSPGFLTIMHNLTRIVFMIIMIWSLTANYKLIHKYGHIAEQFYSDIADSKQNNAKSVNYAILAAGGISFIVVSLGRTLLAPKDWLIYFCWTMFSLLLCMMGNSAIRQKLINPSLDPAIDDHIGEDHTKVPIKDGDLLMNRIIAEFTLNKHYLNSNLNIMDVKQIVGSNRTYISAIINQHTGHNFCSFVNEFRIEELKVVLIERKDCKNDELAQRCGFGTVNSMKRAILFKNGLSIADFKKQIERNPLQLQQKPNR